MDDGVCECSRHGKQPITFVCRHITSIARPDTVGFVSGPPEGEDDLRDAWCGDCDAYRQKRGGEWIEGSVEVPDGVVILCADCYRLREGDALRAGRRLIR